MTILPPLHPRTSWARAMPYRNLLLSRNLLFANIPVNL
jgi:hypothetical protein